MEERMSCDDTFDSDMYRNLTTGEEFYLPHLLAWFLREVDYDLGLRYYGALSNPPWTESWRKTTLARLVAVGVAELDSEKRKAKKIHSSPAKWTKCVIVGAGQTGDITEYECSSAAVPSQKPVASIPLEEKRLIIMRNLALAGLRDESSFTPGPSATSAEKLSIMKKNLAPRPSRRTPKRVIAVAESVRRSTRSDGKMKSKEVEDEVKRLIMSGLDDTRRIKIKWFDDRGRGLVTRAPFGKGEFVVEYSGILIKGLAAAREREQFYAQDQEIIDATAETGRMGRLLNHSKKNPNLRPEVFRMTGKLCIIMRALRDIDTNEELLYDYGDHRLASLKNFPWLRS